MKNAIVDNVILAAALLVVPMLAQAQAAPAQQTPPAPAARPAPAPAPAPALTPVPKPVPVAVAPASGGPVGEAVLVTGSVTVAGRSLGNGDAIGEGQTIVVGPNSYASLKFKDGGRVLLRPNTEFAVESFRYAAPAAAPAADGVPLAAAAPAGSSAFFRLVRGGFRAVTGLIGKGDPQNYRVTTPAATIGIRGTDYEVQTCSADCPTQQRALAGGTEVASTSLAGLELAQAGTTQPGQGILLLTHAGSVVLRTARGETVVDAGQVALALASGETSMLPKVPDALLRNATPAPEECE